MSTTQPATRSEPSPALRWVGDESRFIPGVPARDLSADEAAHFSARVLIASGLYTEAASARPAALDTADSRKEYPR